MDPKRIPIGELGLSVRAYNVLRRNEIHTLGDLLECTEERLWGMRSAGAVTVKELLGKIGEYRRLLEAGELLPGPSDEAEAGAEAELYDLILLPRNREIVLLYARNHDRRLGELGLSTRALNRLSMMGHRTLSDILFLTEAELTAIPSMGAGSVKSVTEGRRIWLEENETGLRAALSGDERALLLEDGEVCRCILRLYNDAPYAGFSLQDYTEKLPERAPAEQLKRCVGALLAQGRLEYVDFRCYRVYPPFALALARCPRISERNRELIRRRLEGETLEAVGRDYDLTRERVRQITRKSLDTVRAMLYAETGSALCDEDYFLYFYQTYAFERGDAIRWFGLSPAAMTYLGLTTDKRGTKSLEEAQEDRALGVGLRQRVRNFLNRDRLFLDGRWLPKRRAELERYVVQRLCVEDTTLDEFQERYNRFLREQGIEYDEKLYLTDAAKRSRMNRLAESRFLLWKYGETLRAYDVDGRDYTELFSALGLAELENVELSTQKFVDEYPEILARYDLRDRYELHNLLRKVLPDGSFHGFQIERTPNILFGSFDRNAALLELMTLNAPISQSALAELIHREYGYDTPTVIGSYLPFLNDYYHQGMYTIGAKVMAPEHREALLAALDRDFYFVEELKRLYARLVPGADPEEINPYNLKQMGFTALSRYALRDHDSLEAYFRDLLTREELLDITELRRRYSHVVMFSQVLMTLKRSLEVVEYEPNRLIGFRRLSRAGVTPEDVREFCDAVYELAEEGRYFTLRSLRCSGFDTELFELGFSDWFYANLLLSDPRFSFGVGFRTVLLIKGKHTVTIRDFEEQLIREAGSIDVYDLQRELEETCGCVVPDSRDLVYKVQGGGVYHDRHLDRLYDSEERYWREVDEAEVLG